MLFEFDPEKTKAEIKLAISYSPKILNYHIPIRTRTGLLYILSGEYFYSWEDSSLLGKSGSLIYLPPNSVPYSYRISETDSEPLRTMQIEIELTDIDSGAPLAFSEHPLLLTDRTDNVTRESFEAIISSHGKNDPASRLITHSELYKLLSLCIKYTAETSLSHAHRSIAAALSFIQENYRNDFSLSELAQLCHISSSQLRRNFITAIGKSPVTYKNELILRDACRFLDSGELSIGEIAEILGFCDIYAFSHFFRKYKGISPTAYKTRFYPLTKE